MMSSAAVGESIVPVDSPFPMPIEQTSSVKKVLTDRYDNIINEGDQITCIVVDTTKKIQPLSAVPTKNTTGIAKYVDIPNRIGLEYTVTIPAAKARIVKDKLTGKSVAISATKETTAKRVLNVPLKSCVSGSSPPTSILGDYLFWMSKENRFKNIIDFLTSKVKIIKDGSPVGGNTINTASMKIDELITTRNESMMRIEEHLGAQNQNSYGASIATKGVKPTVKRGGSAVIKTQRVLLGRDEKGKPIYENKEVFISDPKMKVPPHYKDIFDNIYVELLLLQSDPQFMSRLDEVANSLNLFKQIQTILGFQSNDITTEIGRLNDIDTLVMDKCRSNTSTGEAGEASMEGGRRRLSRKYRRSTMKKGK